MDDTNKPYFPHDILSTINKVIENHTYGSIQIYFEDGVITQITQTSIKKVSHHTSTQNSKISKPPKTLSHEAPPKGGPVLPVKSSSHNP